MGYRGRRCRAPGRRRYGARRRGTGVSLRQGGEPLPQRPLRGLGRPAGGAQDDALVRQRDGSPDARAPLLPRSFAGDGQSDAEVRAGAAVGFDRHHAFDHLAADETRKSRGPRDWPRGRTDERAAPARPRRSGGRGPASRRGRPRRPCGPAHVQVVDERAPVRVFVDEPAGEAHEPSVEVSARTTICPGRGSRMRSCHKACRSASTGPSR